MKWWPMGKKDADLERELRSDLDLEEAEQLERGLAPDEARSAARRAFGNPTLIREQTRAVWAWNRLESLGRDLRYGLRTLGRTPVFTLIVIVVMVAWFALQVDPIFSGKGKDVIVTVNDGSTIPTSGMMR